MSYVKLFVLLTLSLNLAVALGGVHQYVHAQMNNNEIYAQNNNMTSGDQSNTSRIMENTSGIIDDAFNQLKDSFGSFFGK